jgi:ankyrin repeat protein/beta-lactamase regulating signal transducer with metallopeptidase domain
MNSVAALWIEPWVQRLGWVLIHFIWQGTAIALLLAITLRLFARASAHVRYAIIGGALLLCGIMPVVTWAIFGSQSELSVRPATASTLVYTPDIKAPAISDSSSFPDKILWSPSETAIGWRDNFRQVADVALPYVVGLWFSGVLISITRLTLGWAFVWRLCCSGVPIRDSICLERFRNLLLRMQVSFPVRLLESALVEVPMLIGWLRPTILVPASVLTGLTPDQLDAVLVHELAHVRRYDYLANLLQTVIETILFYHPAVWWISRKLREERENCCDDVALEVMQDRIAYVGALAQLEEGRALPLALSVSGGSLLQRIRRIAGVERRKSSLMPVIILAFIVGFLAVPLIGQMATTTVKTTGDISFKRENSALTKALVAAAKQGDLAKIEPLLKQGADPNAMLNSDGMNALLAAVHGDHINVVRLLLQSGADPNCKGGDTDRFALSYTKNAAMVKVLLDEGADPNGKGGRITPLMDAPDPESVRLLVQHGAKLNPRFSDGRSLLEIAVGNELYERSLGDRWDVIAELIKQGAEFDPKGNGPTLLVLAAMEGKTNIARGLIDAGISPDAYATRGIFLVSPLTEAAFARSPDMIRLLLSRGAHVSAWRGNTSPLSAALNSGRYDNANVLRQAGENDVGYFSEYCARGDSAKVNELLKAGANANETDNFGATPLMYAIRQGHPEIVRVLFEHGANINQFNSAGTTPYSLFQDLSSDFKRYPGAMQDDWGIPGSVHANEAKRRMADLESFFKHHPINPNYQDASGRTALHQAALAGNTGELNQLLALRPDINAKDNNGNTPLLLAASSPLASNLATRYVDEASAKEWNAEARIADQLIKAGAKLDLLMADGKTVGEGAMAAAIKAKNPQLISVLREAGVAKTVSPPQSPVVGTGTKVTDGGAPDSGSSPR